MSITLKRYAVLGAALVVSAAATGRAEAQVAVADARAFVGDWNVAVEGDAPAEIRINIKDQGGQVAVVVTNSEGRDINASAVKKEGDNLVINYTTTLQGTELPGVITLTPDGAGLKGALDLAGGMFTAPLKGTKRPS